MCRVCYVTIFRLISSIKFEHRLEGYTASMVALIPRKSHKYGASHVTLLSLQSPVFARLPGFETEGGAIGVLPPGKMRNGTFCCLYGRDKPQNLCSVMMEK